MWLFACCLILSVGFILTENPVSKPGNTTKAANNIRKRYIITIPQYNALLYTNSQGLPKHQFLVDNTQRVINYIGNLQGKSAPYGVPPNYYFLNNNIAPPYVIQNVVPQRLFLQQLLQQEVVPQQVIQPQLPPQQTLQNEAPQIQSAQEVSPQQFLQSTVPQQLPQRIIQGAVKQQVIPTQLLRQQIAPQQAVLQRIVPQGVVLQQLLVPQLLTQQVTPQRLATPQAIPQRIVSPKVVPQQIVTQRTQNIQATQSQGIPFPIQNNVLPGLVQQRILPFPFPNQVPVHLQYPFYQAEPPRPRVAVNKEPYAYEIPPGQLKLPLNAGHHPQINPSPPPQYGVPQYRYDIPPGETKQHIETDNHAQIHVNPLPIPQYGVPQSFIYNPSSSLYRQQQQVNPQPLYINPYIQSTTGNSEQVVRIGYGHLHQTDQGAVQNTQPHNHAHRIYIQPNVGNAQPEVRIGYGLNLGFEGNDNGPQQFKLEIPLAYSDVAGNQIRGIGYHYGNNARSSRTINDFENGKFKLTEAERIKS